MAKILFPLKPFTSIPSALLMKWDLILRDLALRGFSVQKNIFCTDQLAFMSSYLEELKRNDLLRQAKTASGPNPSIRGDLILWLDDSNSSFFTYYLNELQDLKSTINQEFFLSLKTIESHLTVYPSEKLYEKHFDNYQRSNSRKLSVILYLNHEWQNEDGGQLIIYGGAEKVLAEVLPCLGTFVIFKSEDFLHEVKPAVRDRKSITSWLRI